MVRPATGWTSAAVVNGLMAIVLVAWLVDRPTPSPARDPTPVAERDREPPPASPPEAPATIELPAPPPRATASANDIAPPAEIVPLRAAPKERPANAPIPTPLRPAMAVPPDEHEPDPVDRKVPGGDVTVDADTVRTGRALLRILEHGDGPRIDIAWPGSRAARERLHDVLRSCFGMRLALIDHSGGLYLDAGPRGRTWPIDLDRFSGFVRRPNGRIASAEQRAAARVRHHHRRLPETEPVRLFPRPADAALLGGLARLLGDGYRSSRAITASYRLRGGRVRVDGIRIDGRRIAGEIDLTRGASPACRRTGRT
jgi:hypothetical protein